jgi:hypothetical protein
LFVEQVNVLVEGLDQLFVGHSFFGVNNPEPEITIDVIILFSFIKAFGPENQKISPRRHGGTEERQKIKKHEW